MSGRVGDLNSFQEKTLKEFKDSVLDLHKPEFDDYYYLRWLRARNFDKQLAEDMMRKNLVWRKKIGADSILTEYKPPEILDKFYPRGFLGPDKDGCPVRYLPFKNLDFKGFVLSISKQEILKFLTYMFEQDLKFMAEESKKVGKVLETHSYIIDIEGYTFRQATNRHCVDMLNEILKLYEANYPERLKIACFINAPAYFSIALALSKPFLSENTLNKFKIFGKDGFQELLCSMMDPKFLPVFLGGTRTDPDGDPLCKSIINYGEFVPKSSYFRRTNQKCSITDFKSVVLEKRSSYCIDVEIKKPHTKLQWEVETNKHDVAVGLFYRNSPKDNKTEKTNLEMVLPIERINSHILPESCAFICEKVGTYVLKFDNSYSWFTQKKVFYKLAVMSPDEMNAQD